MSDIAAYIIAYNKVWYNTARKIEDITPNWRRQAEMIKKAQEMGVSQGVDTGAGATGVCHGGGF